MTDTPELRDRDDVLLRVEHLTVEFDAGGGNLVHAVSDVSFDIARGETLGLVGESGCGKSTTGRAIVRLVATTTGSVQLDGLELTTLDEAGLRSTRAQLQFMYQDPVSSLNPRRRIRDTVAEGLLIQRLPPAQIAERVRDVLDAVGLDPDALGHRRPREFSGGQSQRICLARSLVLEPEVLICDEPVSALDVSVQAQILNLFEEMKQRYGLTMLFIAHDLAVVRHLSDRVAVMYLGRLCELGDTDSVFENPAHPYTRGLLASIPLPQPGSDPATPSLDGDLPSPLAPPSGCRFRTRCPLASELCRTVVPEMRAIGSDHLVACHHPVTDPGEAATI